jgi:hypothetical protein
VSATRRASDWARRQASAYRQDADDERPLGGYVAALSVYAAVTGATTLLGRALGRQAPAQVRPWDVALLGLATHKTTRLLAKDAVTSPLRAPFTRFEDASGDAELSEQVRKPSGARHAVGELITCPFCLAQWVSTAFVAGSVFAPGLTRLATTTMAGVAVSDFLQLGYAAAQQVAEG